MADPGFPIGGVPTRWGGRQPLTRTLFSENVCKNERNGSCGGGGGAPAAPPPGSANAVAMLPHTAVVFRMQSFNCLADGWNEIVVIVQDPAQCRNDNNT